MLSNNINAWQKKLVKYNKCVANILGFLYIKTVAINRVTFKYFPLILSYACSDK